MALIKIEMVHSILEHTKDIVLHIYFVLYRKIVHHVANHTGTQAALPPMQVSRHCHTSAAACSRVFVFGGLNERDELRSSCEFYDSRIDR